VARGAWALDWRAAGRRACSGFLGGLAQWVFFLRDCGVSAAPAREVLCPPLAPADRSASERALGTWLNH
jgi:hypothetical protein